MDGARADRRRHHSFPHGDPHDTRANGSAGHAVDAVHEFREKPGRGTDAGPTFWRRRRCHLRFVCGFFACEPRLSEVFLSGLPPMLKSPRRERTLRENGLNIPSGFGESGCESNAGAAWRLPSLSGGAVRSRRCGVYITAARRPDRLARGRARPEYRPGSRRCCTRSRRMRGPSRIWLVASGSRARGSPGGSAIFSGESPMALPGAVAIETGSGDSAVDRGQRRVGRRRRWAMVRRRHSIARVQAAGVPIVPQRNSAGSKTRRAASQGHASVSARSPLRSPQ